MAINIGLVGTGRIGKVHAENIVYHIKETNLKGIADIDAKSAKEMARLYDVPFVTDDYRKLINNPDIQAIFICSATQTHAEIIKEATIAGKHVFCEKPIDLDLQKVQGLVSLIDNSNIKFQLGFNRRFDSEFQTLRNLLQSGKMGNIHLLHITSRDPMPPPLEYLKVSGGIFLDMTIHDFDMARFLTNSEVTEVYATGGTLIDPSFADVGDIDTAVTMLRFENGAIGTINNSRKTSYGYDQRVEVLTEQGMLSVLNRTENQCQILDEKGSHSSVPLHFFLERYLQSFQKIAQSFVDSILNDTPTEITATDGLIALKMGMAAKKSIAENRPVRLDSIG